MKIAPTSFRRREGSPSGSCLVPLDKARNHQNFPTLSLLMVAYWQMALPSQAGQTIQTEYKPNTNRNRPKNEPQPLLGLGRWYWWGERNREPRLSTPNSPRSQPPSGGRPQGPLELSQRNITNPD